jgi:hypothetical protein
MTTSIQKSHGSQRDAEVANPSEDSACESAGVCWNDAAIRWDTSTAERIRRDYGATCRQRLAMDQTIP